MAKNKGFKFNEAKHKQDTKRQMAITEQWVKQAGLDAALITLGYGSCMGKGQYGAERLVRFGEEFIKNLWWVCEGLAYSPDADAVRAKVDKLLKDKLPEESYREWGARYAFWVDKTLEDEARDERNKWIREGVNLKDDGGTSELLKGVGR